MFRDVSFPEGTIVMVCAFTGNRDLRRTSAARAGWAGPISFDITAARGRARELTFGAGVHYCVGANLARVELREALSFLARHVRGLELDGEPAFESITRHLRPRRAALASPSCDVFLGDTLANRLLQRRRRRSPQSSCRERPGGGTIWEGATTSLRATRGWHGGCIRTDIEAGTARCASDGGRDRAGGDAGRGGAAGGDDGDGGRGGGGRAGDGERGRVPRVLVPDARPAKSRRSDGWSGTTTGTAAFAEDTCAQPGGALIAALRAGNAAQSQHGLKRRGRSGRQRARQSRAQRCGARVTRTGARLHPPTTSSGSRDQAT